MCNKQNSVIFIVYMLCTVSEAEDALLVLCTFKGTTHFSSSRLCVI